MRYNKTNERIFTDEEKTHLITELGELIHSKSFDSDTHYDIFELIQESKYYDADDVIEDLSSYEIDRIIENHADYREIAEDYVDGLSTGELAKFLSPYTDVIPTVFKSLDDEYKYRICMALMKHVGSSYELEQLLGDDLIRHLRYTL